MPKDKTNDYLLSSVKNALHLLKSFSIDEPEKKVTELAASLGLGKSTISRLLATLASEGFVMKNPENGKYRLGLSILNLNTVLTSNLEVSRESLPILQALVRDIDETAHLAAKDEYDVVYLNRVDCNHPVRILSHIGRHNPSHATSSGKTILAHQPDEFIEEYIQVKMEKYTPYTITNPEDLKATLLKVKEQGYAISIEEMLEGVASIAAPIYDYTGQVLYAISVIGPVPRLNPNSPGIIDKVKRAAADISRNLGYHPN